MINDVVMMSIDIFIINYHLLRGRRYEILSDIYIYILLSITVI